MGNLNRSMSARNVMSCFSIARFAQTKKHAKSASWVIQGAMCSMESALSGLDSLDLDRYYYKRMT